MLEKVTLNQSHVSLLFFFSVTVVWFLELSSSLTGDWSGMGLGLLR